MQPGSLTHQQQQCALFRLPPELRDLIYRFLLVKATPISPQWRSHREEERLVLPLFQTCQRVRQEATKVYFGSNTFRFYDDGELDEIELPLFFRSLSTGNLKLCAHISLESSLGPQHSRQCFSKYCVGSIEIDLSSLIAETSGRTNCCNHSAEQLTRARDKVQAVLSRIHDLGILLPAERARLGSEVGIEFCATFEHLHPDYGD